MIYALYNPYVANHTGENSAKNLIEIFKEEKIEFLNLLTLDYKEFFSNLNQDDSVILCGGDGTLNRFVNDVTNIEIKHNIYYYAIGSGNDFLRDLEKSDNSPFLINEFLNKLPTVNIEDKDYSFLNGIGLGIDGFICYEGNRLREQTKNKINYTLLAIKALLFQYKPCNATVTVDGKEYNFKNVWLATNYERTFFRRRNENCT